MSENDPNEDFSQYEGSYQAGQLLHEDGEIDLDELGDPSSTRAPVTVQLLFVLFLTILGAGGYYVFILSKPKVQVVPKLVKPKIDETVKKTYTALKDTKSAFSSLFACLLTVERNHKSSAPSLQKELMDDCKALKAGSISYQLVCKDKESCKYPTLGKCSGGKCEPVAGVSYMDFLYALMLRYADSYDELYAFQRLYYTAQRKFKKSGKKDAASKKAMEDYVAKMSAFLNKKESKHWTSPHFGIAPAMLYTQAIAYASAVNKAAGVKADDNKAVKKKKKRRRRRRRRRRRAKKAATVKEFKAGTFYLFKNFPVKALSVPGYSTLFQSERMSRQASLIRKFNYTPMAIHFWLNMLLKHKAQACAASAKVSETLNASFEFNTEIERIIGDSIKIADGGAKACMTRVLGQLRIFSTIADDKKIKVTFQIKAL